MSVSKPLKGAIHVSEARALHKIGLTVEVGQASIDVLFPPPSLQDRSYKLLNMNLF